MNLELVKIINKAKTNAVEVAFWIKSKKKENLDKYMEILKERKRWNEALLFAALRFEEVATEAMKENKQDE